MTTPVSLSRVVRGSRILGVCICPKWQAVVVGIIDADEAELCGENRMIREWNALA